MVLVPENKEELISIIGAGINSYVVWNRLD